MPLQKTFAIDPQQVQAVVFDLGGVFLLPGINRARRFGVEQGLSEADWATLHHQLFLADPAAGDAQEALWNRVERGEATLDWFAGEMVARFADRGTALDPAIAPHFMGHPGERGGMPVRPEIVDVCIRLRQHLPTALLTNNIREWAPRWRGLLDTDALFVTVVDSCEVGSRKPEPAIYAEMERRLDLPPEGLLFIDDLGVNLKAAKARGWQTLKYVDTAEVLDVLNAVVRQRELGA